MLKPWFHQDFPFNPLTPSFVVAMSGGYGPGVYLLCFDGGADRAGEDGACRGGAGAVLKQLKATSKDRDARRRRNHGGTSATGKACNALQHPVIMSCWTIQEWQKPWLNCWTFIYQTCLVWFSDSFEFEGCDIHSFSVVEFDGNSFRCVLILTVRWFMMVHDWCPFFWKRFVM